MTDRASSSLNRAFFWFFAVNAFVYAIVGFGANPSWLAPGMDHRVGNATALASWALARSFRSNP